MKEAATEAAYSVKAAKTNTPISVATPIAIRTRKNMVMPEEPWCGSPRKLKAILMPPEKGPLLKRKGGTRPSGDGKGLVPQDG